MTAPEGPVAAGLPVVAEIGGKALQRPRRGNVPADGDIWYVVIVDHSSTGPDFAGCGALGAEVRFKEAIATRPSLEPGLPYLLDRRST